MNYFLDAFKKFADFSGRARRPEYWFFVLFIYIITFVLYGIDYLVLNAGESGYGIFSSLFGLVTLVPSISVAVRRLHDTGRSGLWYLIALIRSLLKRIFWGLAFVDIMLVSPFGGDTTLGLSLALEIRGVGSTGHHGTIGHSMSFMR